VAALAVAVPARAYSWPVKPFDVPHAIRGTFGDPRYHLGNEEQLSESFHFGVDIVGRDGEPVYAVEPAVVLRRHATSLTLAASTGRRFGYWHVRPVVRSGTYVRLHQIVGYILPGWGHVHFAESVDGAYRNPLRKGALTPFFDTTAPTVTSVALIGTSGGGAVSGVVSVTADISDTPPIVPGPPWEITRLAPSFVSWTLFAANGFPMESHVTADFDFDLPPNDLYGAIYAPGTYQNKPNRPGHYLFWIARALDTTTLPNGAYRLQVTAADTRHNQGVGAVEFTVSN
jgi:murein DD-endopeptidase MepM/ murein hydrolase activator NlpD